jgi:Domain of unknown function (DUF4276)
MVEGIRIYVEGDAKRKGKYSQTSLRQGFHEFFKDLREQAKAKRVRFDIILGGNKSETFKDFQRGIKSHQGSFVSFLIDSDNEIGENETAKSFLEKQNKSWSWKNVTEDQCHLMVQIMESWFVADVETLKSFYGNNFSANAIPKHDDLEKVAKVDIEKSLKKATEKTAKAEYNKIKHGAELLAKMDIHKVRAKSKHCELLFSTLENKLIS